MHPFHKLCREKPTIWILQYITAFVKYLFLFLDFLFINLCKPSFLVFLFPLDDSREVFNSTHFYKILL